MIIYQKHNDYISPLKRHWYGYARGYTDGKDIYINVDAFFIDKRDKNLLIEHELGHINGRLHNYFGLMSPYGLVRYLTAW